MSDRLRLRAGPAPRPVRAGRDLARAAGPPRRRDGAAAVPGGRDAAGHRADTTHAAARARRRATPYGSPPASSRCWTPSGSARCAHLDQRRPRGRRACWSTPSATSGPVSHAWSRRLPPAACWASADRSAPAGRWPTPGAATSCSSPAASGWPRCGPPSSRSARADGDYGRVAVLYGARTPADDPVPRRPAGLGPVARHRRAGHRRQRPGGLARAGSVWSPSCSPGPGWSAHRTTALVCGPEVMMRHAARALLGLAAVPPPGCGCRWSAT